MRTTRGAWVLACGTGSAIKIVFSHLADSSSEPSVPHDVNQQSVSPGFAHRNWAGPAAAGGSARPGRSLALAPLYQRRYCRRVITSDKAASRTVSEAANARFFR